MTRLSRIGAAVACFLSGAGQARGGMTVWLSQFEERRYVKRISPYAELKQAALALDMLAVDNDYDLQLTRRALLKEGRWDRQEELFVDHFNVLFFTDRAGRVSSWIIIPRDPPLFRANLFAHSSPEGSGLTAQLTELPAVIAQFQGDRQPAVPQTD